MYGRYDDTDCFSRIDSDDGSLVDSQEENYRETEKKLQEKLWLWEVYEKEGMWESIEEGKVQHQVWEASEDDGVADRERLRKSGSVPSKRPSFWRLNKNALLFGTSGALLLGPPGAVVGTVYGMHRDKKKNYFYV